MGLEEKGNPPEIRFTDEKEKTGGTTWQVEDRDQGAGGIWRFLSASGGGFDRIFDSESPNREIGRDRLDRSRSVAFFSGAILGDDSRRGAEHARFTSTRA